MRTRALTIGAVAVIVTIGLFRSCTATSTSDESAVPTTSPSATASGDIGPSRIVDGVPRGWRHDQAGARAAALSAVSLTGEIARAGFITRGDMIRALASAQFGPTLATESATQLADVFGEITAAGVAPSAVLFHELVLTARVVRADTLSAVVDVWSVLVAGLPDSGAPRQAWRTVTVTVVWESDDWRIDGWDAQAGPTPALASNAAISTVDDVATVIAWPSADNGGS